MRRRFWLTLDAVGHKVPLLRFGRLRYAICLRADAYMTEAEFDTEFAKGEPVELVGTPKITITSSWPLDPTPQAWWTASGNSTGTSSTNITWRNE